MARRGKASSISTALPLRGSRPSKVVHGRAPPWAPESVLLLLEIGHYRRNRRPCNTKAMRMSVLLSADKASTHAWTHKHTQAVATQGVYHRVQYVLLIYESVNVSPSIKPRTAGRLMKNDRGGSMTLLSGQKPMWFIVRAPRLRTPCTCSFCDCGGRCQPHPTLYVLLCRLCWQMLPPPHSLHWFPFRLCSQMLDPPHPLPCSLHFQEQNQSHRGEGCSALHQH